ncbi:hypothetical protein [Patulibacter sp.]|uniref:hypothetical protein n=1 Tax=Patulibacter sp. TaxID=1912859 RepID=UPI00271C8D6A|nr:hypothetical protein [Patulibacter sp.]MDO9409190.1 hypothetical protein [Patulibacter sp.]
MRARPTATTRRPSATVLALDLPGSAGRPGRRTLRGVVLAVATLAALAVPAGASAAIPNDGPAGALPLLPATAENGPITERQRTLAFDGATPDAGTPRCLGPASFEQTAWLRVEPDSRVRRLTVEAAVKDGSTSTPDLAAYVQNGATGTDVREPQGCSGRETAGDASRGDLGASVPLVVPAGASVLVQVGWRSGDAAVPVVASAASEALPALPAPAGQAFAGAPFAARGTGLVVALTGATTTSLDPAQPRCASQAGVWRRVRIARKGVYAAATAGDAAGTLTVYSTTPSGDTAKACADDGTTPALTTVFRATRTGTYWLRVGTDTPEKAASQAGLAILGPYGTSKAGTAAAPAARDRAARAIDPKAPCTDRRAPRPAFDATVARKLKRGGRAVRGGNDGAACVNGRSTVSRFTVAVARVRGGRCSWRTGRRFGAPRSCAVPRGARRASGTDRWRTTLPTALPRGARYRVVVRAQVRKGGKLRNSGPRVTLGVKR